MRVGYMGNIEHQNTRVWLEEMAARGVEPVAICETAPSWDVEWAPLRVEPPRVRGLGLGRLSITRNLAAICRDRRLDILHNHQANRHAMWARSSGFRPRVITCWGSDVLLIGEKTREVRAGVRRALSSADAVTVGSHHLLEAAVAAGARRDRCVLVGWGVDTERFQRDETARARIRTEWGFEERIVVLSNRMLKPLYRVDAIVRAFAIARAASPALALVIAGSGPEEEHLRTLSVELGVADDVRFIGLVTRDAWPLMTDVLSGADAYCSVPYSDGGPLSVLEAMSMELPIVASDVPVMREWLIPDKSGILWDGLDEEGLASHILTVASVGDTMGARGRAFVVSHHDRALEMDRVKGMYERLLPR